MTALWTKESEEIVKKLETLAKSADLTYSQVTQIHELTSAPYELIATFKPARMKTLAKVVKGHQIAMEEARRREELAEERIDAEQAKPEAKGRHGLSGIKMGLNSLTSVLQTRELVPHIQKFSGLETAGMTNEFLVWLRGMDRLRMVKTLSDTTMKNICAATLTLKAADYCAKLLAENDDMPWLELRERLNERYSNPATAITAKHALRDMKQGPNESVYDLGERIIATAELAYLGDERANPYFENLVIDVLANSVVNKDTLHRLVTEKPTTFRKGLEIALEEQRNKLTFNAYRDTPVDSDDQTGNEDDQPMETTSVNHVDWNGEDKQTSILAGLAKNQERNDDALRDLTQHFKDFGNNLVAEEETAFDTVAAPARRKHVDSKNYRSRKRPHSPCETVAHGYITDESKSEVQGVEYSDHRTIDPLMSRRNTMKMTTKKRLCTYKGNQNPPRDSSYASDSSEERNIADDNEGDHRKLGIRAGSCAANTIRTEDANRQGVISNDGANHLNCQGLNHLKQ